MTTTPQAEPARAQFLAARPDDLHRKPPPWHRLAYIVRELPRTVERLVGDLHLAPGDRVLDYGCADMPYHHLFETGVEIVPADLPGNDSAAVEIAPDGTLPLPDASFDAVLSTQVLEHVGDPAVYLGECFRVLRSGGRLLLSTHGLMVYHPDPVDYWRWTCAGLQEAVRRAGFETLRFEGTMGLAATGFQMVQDAWYYRLPRALRPIFALITQTLAALADRIEPRESRDLNSMVFALVAEKP